MVGSRPQLKMLVFLCLAFVERGASPMYKVLSDSLEKVALALYTTLITSYGSASSSIFGGGII